MFGRCVSFKLLVVKRVDSFILDQTGVLQHTFYKLHASATETMSELNITLEHQPNNNRFESEEQQATVTTGNR